MRKYIFLISVIIFLCYSNSFQVPWQLDDPPNITKNYLLQIETLSIESISQSFYAKPFQEGHLYRPIANLSFAINWYHGQDNPFGYHVVNLLIHIITAFYLFKSSKLLLLRTLSQKEANSEDVLAIALLSSILWAINPIQTQAVTYIVQRMASMAGMFFIISVYHFIAARHFSTNLLKTKHFVFSSVFFIFAMGCKENAITLIPVLLLIEVYFFLPDSNSSKRVYKILLATNILLLTFAVYYIISSDLLSYLNKPVGSRPFSISERLLTQPSILLFYLSQIYYPAPLRLSIDHSFPLSTSLFSHWYTLPAILLILVFIGFAVNQRQKRPLIGFAVLFFLITHAVESSIIPLEMVFEHRNYIPSFFLFLPVSVGVFYVFKKVRSANSVLYGTLLFALVGIIIVIGIGTYSRNEVWRSEESLWADALKKAPDSARPFAKLGEIYGWEKEKNQKNLRIATGMLNQALTRTSQRVSIKTAIAGNIAKIYRNYGMLDEGIEYYNKSLEFNPMFLDSRFGLSETLMLQGEFSQALQQLDLVISQNDQQSRFFNLRTALLLWLDRPQEAAVSSTFAVHKTFVNKERYFYNTGVALGRAGHFSQGIWFLKIAHKNNPGSMRILLSIIENSILAKRYTEAREFIALLLEQHGLSSILLMMENMRTDYSSVPIDIELIQPFIIKEAQQQIKTI